MRILLPILAVFITMSAEEEEKAAAEEADPAPAIEDDEEDEDEEEMLDRVGPMVRFSPREGRLSRA